MKRFYAVFLAVVILLNLLWYFQIVGFFIERDFYTTYIVIFCCFLGSYLKSDLKNRVNK